MIYTKSAAAGGVGPFDYERVDVDDEATFMVRLQAACQELVELLSQFGVLRSIRIRSSRVARVL
jgi:hypothetical protein